MHLTSNLPVLILLLCSVYETTFCQRDMITVDHDSYTVCQKFRGTFDPDRQSHTPRGQQGAPGKRGPKGDKGSLGNIAESEIVKNLANELELIKSCAGLYRAGVCYFLLEDRVNYENAVSRCERRGGHLASITSRQLYGALYRFVYDGFVIWQSATYIQFWIDGTYSNTNGAVAIRDAELSPYTLWYPGYPRSTAGHIYMAFEVKKSSTGNQNMFNINSRHTAYILCERK